MAKADSGASTHSFSSTSVQCLHNIKPLINGPNVKLPDGTSIIPDQTGQLSLHGVSTKGNKVHIHKNLKNTALISVGQLCDDGCTATFDKNSLKISKNNNLVLQGYRNKSDGLWDIPLPHNPIKNSNIIQRYNNKYSINAIIRKDISVHKLANYLHGCAGSPSLSTFQKAIDKGNFLSWPGIEKYKIQ